MIKQVKDQVMMQAFNHIWQTCWTEKGFEFEENPFAEYFLFEQDGVPCGAFQLCDVSKLPLDENSVYLSHETIKQHPEQVIEIDKLSILKEYRGSTILSQLFLFMMKYAEQNDKRYFVALCEPMLYVSIIDLYNVPVEKLGEPFYYKGDYVVPIIVDLVQAKNHFKQKTHTKSVLIT